VHVSQTLESGIGMPAGLKLDFNTDNGFPDIYMAEQSQNSVRFVDHATGILSTVAGTGSPSSCGTRPFAPYNFSWPDICFEDGDGGPARKAHFKWMHHAAVDSRRGVYICDSDSHAIRYVDPISKNISTIVGQMNKMGYSGDGGPASSALINWPTDVAVDPQTQDIYITDAHNGAVRKVHGSSGKISTIYTGIEPVDLVLVPRIPGHPDLYVADGGSKTIVHIDGATGVATHIVGKPKTSDEPGAHSGDGGLATEAEMVYPHSVALDEVSGDLFIADFEAHVIRRVDGETGIISTIMGEPFVSGASRDRGLANQTIIAGPTVVEVDPIRRRLFVVLSQNWCVGVIQL